MEKEEIEKHINFIVDRLRRESEILEQSLYRAYRISILVDATAYSIDKLNIRGKITRLDGETIDMMKTHIEDLKKWILDATARIVNIEEAFQEILYDINALEEDEETEKLSRNLTEAVERTIEQGDH